MQRVARVVKDEEHRYASTFLVAEKVFSDEISRLSNGTVPGSVAFKLYDTYGLALDEQEDIARERGVEIDRAGFESEMSLQRERARASWKGGEKGAIAPAYRQLLEKGRTHFLGYEKLDAVSTVRGLLVNQQLVDELPSGADGEVVLDQTPFYAETGGQVGDRGTLYSAHSGEIVAVVEDTPSGCFPASLFTRSARCAGIHIGDELRAEVGIPERWATMRNHTATHLLHAALRKVLGPHENQAGSVVEPPRLRFDFTHYAALDPAEITEVEAARQSADTAQHAGHHRRDGDRSELSQPARWRCSAKSTAKHVRVVSIPDFQQGTVRRHSRDRERATSAYSSDRFRKQHFSFGCAPHRSHHGQKAR